MSVRVIIAAVLMGLLPSEALADSLWETTFSCDDWDQGMRALDCDGVRRYGDWTSSGHPDGDEITADANHPGGAGGSGFRHWRGDGTNSNGGGVTYELPDGAPEIWVRWYMRYQAGFGWDPEGTPNYTKDLYFNVGGALPVATAGFHSSDTFGIAIVAPGSSNPGGSRGWHSTMGGDVSDGQWHCYEVHMKMDTDGTDGVREAWIDGTLAHSSSNIDWGTTGLWRSFVIGENQAIVDNDGVEMYTDYDDFAVSTDAYIGPIEAPGPDAGVDPGDPPIGVDAGTDSGLDAGIVPGTDAGPVVGTADAGSQEGGARDERSGGCSCSTRRASGRSAGAADLLGLGLAVAVGRRRRRS